MAALVIVLGGMYRFQGLRFSWGLRNIDDQGLESGAAYVFEFASDSWTQVDKLVPGDGNTLSFFGREVSLSESRALIGAFGDDENGFSAGLRTSSKTMERVGLRRRN